MSESGSHERAPDRRAKPGDQDETSQTSSPAGAGATGEGKQPQSPGSPSRRLPDLLGALWLWPGLTLVLAAIAGKVWGSIAALIVATEALATMLLVAGHRLFGGGKLFAVVGIALLLGATLLLAGLRQLEVNETGRGTPRIQAPSQGAQVLDLRGQRVTAAMLSTRDLRGGLLTGATLDSLDLRGRDLDGVKAAGASFKRAKLQGASLRGGDLRGADFSEACLRGIDLTSASVQGAAFGGADLRSAVLRDVDIKSTIGWPAQDAKVANACG